MKKDMKKPKKKKRDYRRTCVGCGNTFSVTKGEITFDSDPYSSEINNDDTKVWECDGCRHNSLMDI